MASFEDLHAVYGGLLDPNEPPRIMLVGDGARFIECFMFLAIFPRRLPSPLPAVAHSGSIAVGRGIGALVRSTRTNCTSCSLNFVV